MEEKVLNFIRENELLHEKDHVVVGISGGADSMALLHFLIHVKKIYALTLHAVHINHGIRGKEALRDQEFVEDFCHKNQVECLIFSKNIPEYAKKYHLTVEEAGRKFRYECFQKIAQKQDAKIAVAHHMDDQAETLLFHIIRGTGIKGLCGMQPKSGNIIRPFLCVTKDEIYDYLNTSKLMYVEDSTNQDTTYVRNMLRHEILPDLSKVNKNAVLHLCELAKKATLTQEFVEMEAKEAKKKCCEKIQNDFQIKKEEFDKISHLIQRELVKDVLKQVAKKEQDLYEEHVKMVCQLMENQVGKKVNLPYRMQAVRNYAGIRIQRISQERIEKTSSFTGMKLAKHGEHRYILPKKLGIIEIKEFEKVKNLQIPNKMYTKLIDCDTIKNTLVIRHRKDGDFICIDQSGRKKKLSRYFIDEKIPKEERENVLLLADGSEIVWVIGYRIGSTYKVTEKTRHILQIEYWD